MNNLDFKVSSVFIKNLEAIKNYKYIVNVGGTRSGKTYSILQLLIYICLTEKKTIHIVKRTLRDLRGSAYKEFVDILKTYNIYNPDNHNKTDSVYKFDNGSEIVFIGADDDNKIRGWKRDILFLNEANALAKGIFLQLGMRTKENIIIDYNPSDFETWIDGVIEEENSILIKSTYKDNPFLEESQIKFIEEMINLDENYYRIYALGEKPISDSRIYTHFKEYIKKDFDDYWYGLDFGFNHPTALVQINHMDGEYYLEEKIYGSNLTSEDLIKRMDEIKINKNKEIYADYARPEIIEDIRRAGYNIKNANKEVKAGINKLKSSKIFIEKGSTNIWNEYRKYNWKTDRDGRILDDVVKMNDDAMDAIRYGIYTHTSKGGSVVDFFDFSF